MRVLLTPGLIKIYGYDLKNKSYNVLTGSTCIKFVHTYLNHVHECTLPIIQLLFF